MIGNKSEIRFLKEDNYIKIGNLTEIGEFKRDREEINRTDYQSKTVQTQLTLEDNGEISLMFNYNALNQAQEDVETLFSENAVIDWEFYINDENGTTLRFVGSVKSFSITSPNTDNVRIDASIRVNGGFTKVYPSKGIVRFTNFRSDDINLPARTMISKTVSNVKYSFRTTTKASLLGNSTVDVVVIGMNAGPVGNFPDNTSFSGGGSTFAIVSQGAFTGGNLDGTPVETPEDPNETVIASQEDFQNSYLGGVTYNNTANTITSTVASWGNSGAFGQTEITGDGAIFANVTTAVTPEQMFGLSYKHSEADATSLTYALLDYAWYFRSTDGLAYVREANADGLSNHNATDYTALSYNDTNIYGVARNGTTITYLINSVVVYTSSVATTNNSLYFDIAFNSVGNAFNNMLVANGTVYGTQTTEQLPFTPDSDNTNKLSVSITNAGSTITSTNTTEAWGQSGSFSTESIAGAGYISFKVTQTNKRFMVGLSRASDASSKHYNTIDYAIYIDGAVIQIYENGSPPSGGTSTTNVNSTYKINKTGNTITYLKDNVVFYTSLVTSSVDLHLDTAFHSSAGVATDIKMLS